MHSLAAGLHVLKHWTWECLHVCMLLHPSVRKHPRGVWLQRLLPIITAAVLLSMQHSCIDHHTQMSLVYCEWYCTGFRESYPQSGELPSAQC